MINKDIPKLLSHKKGNEILIWSWNESLILLYGGREVDYLL